MIKNVWEKLPAWGRGLVSVVVLLFVLAVMNLLSEAAGRDNAWGGIVVPLVFFVLAVSFVVALNRRSAKKLGGRGQFRLLRRALLTGKLPPDADRATWRPLLEKAVSNHRSDVWFFAFFALVVVLVNVLTLSELDDPGPGVIAVVVAISLVVAGGWVGIPYLVRRRQHRSARKFLALMGEERPTDQ